jgi:nucleotide-binding universal stress UspA family protein
MARNKPILLAEDMSPDAGAARRSAATRKLAAALARRLETSITLVHVEDLQLFPLPEADYRSILDRYFSDQKARFRKQVSGMGVPVSPYFVAGNPVARLLDFVRREGRFELAVLGTHGRTGLGRLFLGSVAEEVLRHSRIPVMTVGPRAQGGNGTLAGDPLFVVATDLTGNSARAERYASALARRTGGRLLLVHSLKEAMHPVLQTAYAARSQRSRLEPILGQLRGDAERSLERRARSLGAGGRVKVETAVDNGRSSAAEAVLARAKKHGASYVVCGTHGRSLLAGAFFGRTARDVILGSPVPVITVRSRG